MVQHLLVEHPSHMNERQLSTYADMCERDMDDKQSDACLICSEKMPLSRLYEHLATHMEEIALFVLPMDPDDHEDEQIKELTEGEGEYVEEPRLALLEKQLEEDAGKTYVKFTDAIGRKFTLPWVTANTWTGMENMIVSAFLDIERISPYVLNGYYRLLDSNGGILLPQDWDSMVQPGWEVTMQLWPMTEATEEDIARSLAAVTERARGGSEPQNLVLEAEVKVAVGNRGELEGDAAADPLSAQLFATSVPAVRQQMQVAIDDTTQEDDGDIKCICGMHHDDGFAVQCETCNNWQHMVCYYPNEADYPLERHQKHYCSDCEPRWLDTDQARERQRKQLQQLDGGNEAAEPERHQKGEVAASRAHIELSYQVDEVAAAAAAVSTRRIHEEEVKKHREHAAVERQGIVDEHERKLVADANAAADVEAELKSRLELQAHEERGHEPKPYDTKEQELDVEQGLDSFRAQSLGLSPDQGLSQAQQAIPDFDKAHGFTSKPSKSDPTPQQVFDTHSTVPLTAVNPFSQSSDGGSPEEIGMAGTLSRSETNIDLSNFESTSALSRRFSTSSRPRRSYLTDFATPERAANGGNDPKRTQKHPTTFQCTMCTKSFTRAYNLRSHLRTHTDGRPFVCNVCNIGFARQHDLNHHKSSHSHGEAIEFEVKDGTKEDFFDFCLICDKQTSKGLYCSEACRLADYEQVGSLTPSLYALSETHHEVDTSKSSGSMPTILGLYREMEGIQE
ncbi:unnamed protein product [Aureobasidium uvarum]|uniref:C2H2-type domain-containing protein n=1 Tax=Aureobasidium uvarum TaxID=2773716 RepID=A0A9N8KT95_9PEZI|nr:unnamed protein product [Aureobasidium uvarum]